MEQEASIHFFPGRQSGRSRGQAVYFSRPELSQLLNIYGRRVASGDWKDYALDMLNDVAIFSIFRRNSEAPLYRVIKEPALSNRQGMWRIVGPVGQTLKRGKELEQLLKYFEVKATPATA